MRKQIPLQEDRPEGLHLRYVIRKVIGQVKTKFGHEIKLKTKAVDPSAEYFVMRLDLNGSDINHILACREAMQVYADKIEETIPELAKDIRERWPIPFKGV